jgi:predicted SAM-dependent methyltransferase
MTAEENGVIRVHLGCGLITPPNWVNMDGSWNARLAKHPRIRRALHMLHITEANKIQVHWNPNIVIQDLRKPLPFRDCSVRVVYSSHVLEHMYFEDGQRLIRECFRVLEKGGVLRLVVPDLQSIVREYLGERPFREPANEAERLPPADQLNRRLLMRGQAPPSRKVFSRLYSFWADFHSHKWMYDADSLTHHLESAGFIEVRQMDLHHSRISGIEQIEDPSRVLAGEGVCVEGVKQCAGTVDGPENRQNS